MRTTRRLAALIAGVLSLSSLLAPALAQDATWLASPGSNDFNTGSNWNPATVPTGTAFFNTSSTTSLVAAGNATVGGWTFNAGASDYTFTIDNILTFTGGGIAVNGGSATINSDGAIIFQNSSTAGAVTLTSNNGSIAFQNTSTAGNATINNVFWRFGVSRWQHGGQRDDQQRR